MHLLYLFVCNNIITKYQNKKYKKYKIKKKLKKRYLEKYSNNTSDNIMIVMIIPMILHLMKYSWIRKNMKIMSIKWINF